VNENGELILVAEDNPDDVMLIKLAFQEAGITTPLRFVRDGVEAVEYLGGQGPFTDRAAHPLPVVILLDLKMPRMNGLEVLAWLRSQPGNIRRVPVVVLTSSRVPSDINAAFDRGVNSYIGKPVAHERLREVLSQIHDYWVRLSEQPSVHTSDASTPGGSS
jgi:CheY-like chemotaxis protein